MPKNNTQLEIDYASLIAYLAEVNANELIEIPTAVGFWQVHSARCLNEVGLIRRRGIRQGKWGGK